MGRLLFKKRVKVFSNHKNYRAGERLSEFAFLFSWAANQHTYSLEVFHLRGPQLAQRAGGFSFRLSVNLVFKFFNQGRTNAPMVRGALAIFDYR